MTSSENRILCSTGAFIGRVNGRNHKLIEKYAPKLHCDGFEFMMYPSWYDKEKMEEISEDLNRSGLSFPVFHADKSIGEDISRNEKPSDIPMAYEKFEKNCKLAKRIGAEKMVLHLWGGEPSDRAIQTNIRCFRDLQQMAETYGILLTVENVVCNQKDPMTHIRELLEVYPEICFTFDTKMAAFHNQLEELYLPENEILFTGNHIRHMHINDYAGGYMDWSHLEALHFGEGQIDFQRYFDVVKKESYHGDYTVESTAMRQDGSVDIEKLNQSLDRVRNSV